MNVRQGPEECSMRSFNLYTSRRPPAIARSGLAAWTLAAGWTTTPNGSSAIPSEGVRNKADLKIDQSDDIFVLRFVYILILNEACVFDLTRS